jgi:hypothetical protein
MKNDQQSDRRFECVASGQSLQGEQFLQFAEHGAYLLCVDILGFGPLVERSGGAGGLCGIIDSLDAHRPDAFKTIVVSDTALSYTTVPPTDVDARQTPRSRTLRMVFTRRFGWIRMPPNGEIPAKRGSCKIEQVSHFDSGPFFL